MKVITDRCGTKGQIRITLWKISGGMWATRPADDSTWNGLPEFYTESELLICYWGNGG